LEIKDFISSGLLELYTAGLSSPAQAEQVNHWSIMHPEVKKELDLITACIERYLTINGIEPARLVKRKLFARINNAAFAKLTQADIPAVVKSFPRIARWKAIAAAAIFLLCVSGLTQVLNYRTFTTNGRQVSLLRDSLQGLRARDSLLAAEMRIVQGRYTVSLILKGLEAAPEAVVKVFWAKNTGEVYIGAGSLPAAPSTKRYQFWATVNGSAVNGGMLSNGSNITGSLQKMRSFRHAEAFAITLEPAAGSQVPTGTMYVFGKS
jgi:hypothetical protein